MSWVAINIGSYHSSAAILVGGKLTKVHPLGSSADTCSFPTVAYVSEDHQIRVCAEALAWKCQDPSRFVKDFKYDIHQEQLAFLGVTYRDIITEIFKSIKVSAEAMNGGQPIENVLLSVPNHYGTSDPRIDILEKSAIATGFNHVEFIKEALASSYHYGFDKQEGVALIYDFGEMIFSPALVQSDSNGLHIIASSSGIEAGGKYIDELLYQKLSETCHIEYATDESLQIQQIHSVMAMCREVKEQLSERENVTHPIPINGAGIFKMDRKELDNLISPMLEKTCAECDSLLHRTNIKWKDLSQIIFVGGSSTIPCVKSLFQKYLIGKEANVKFVHNTTLDGELLDPIYSTCLGSMTYLQGKDNVVVPQSNNVDNETLSDKERGLNYFNGIDCQKNWLMAAYCFYQVLLESEDEESYNYLLQIFQTIIDNLRIVNGALVVEPVMDVIGEDSVDLMVEYLCQIQERYEQLGYETFVEEIYKLPFWIEIIEIIHNK